jgi:hypothetical protein
MAKKSLAEIFLYPKTPRVCRARDSRLFWISKPNANSLHTWQTFNSATPPRWHRMPDGDGWLAMA